MKRRNFLKSTAPLAAVPFFGNQFFASVMDPLALDEHLFAATLLPETDRVLVVIQLSGGNDGLNTVLPLDQYSKLANARASILIPDTQALVLGSSQTGLHPAMTGMKELFVQNKLAVVQGVSYANPNLSHFRATDIFSTAASANETLTSGWLGRYLEYAFPGFPDNYPSAEMPDPLAVRIGSSLPFGLQGYELNTAQTIPTGFRGSVTQLLSNMNTSLPSGNAGIELEFLREQQTFTNQYASRIVNAWNGGTNTQTYSTVANNLGAQLRIVARLIKGGLKTRIFWVSMGGFDTHSNQTDATNKAIGNHANLLRELSDAIYTFQKDLDDMQLSDRVLGMTFSEFGRRIKANASIGTDHGVAAPMFLFGNKVKAGIIGSNPVLPDNATFNDQVAMQFDYRGIYASILRGWFCLSQQEAEATLGDTTPMLQSVNTTCTPVVLPVELINFNVQKANVTDAHLTWNTGNESNTSHFDIQRSTDGKSFSTVGKVKAQGHSHEATSYQYLDSQLPIGQSSIFYYRLKINDLDGTTALSPVKSVVFDQAGKKMAADVYPNPSNGRISVALRGEVASDRLTEVIVSDSFGRPILKLSETLTADAPLELDLENAVAGIYILTVRNGTNSFVQKIVLQ